MLVFLHSRDMHNLFVSLSWTGQVSDECDEVGPVCTGSDEFWTNPRSGTYRPCIHTGPLGAGTFKATYLVQSGFTHKWEGPVPLELD